MGTSIPDGSFLLGDTQKVAGFSQKRLAVTLHRLLMPDGYSVDLDQFDGLDAVGDSGLRDKVNNHYLEIFDASITHPHLIDKRRPDDRSQATQTKALFEKTQPLLRCSPAQQTCKYPP